MQPFKDAEEALKAYQLFLREHWTTLPQEVKDEVTKRDGPGVNEHDRIAYPTEAMYAHRTKPGVNNKAARELIGRTASYLGALGILYFREGRGYQIMRAMERENKEPLAKGTGPYPAQKDDPKPIPEFDQSPAPEPTPVP